MNLYSYDEKTIENVPQEFFERTLRGIRDTTHPPSPLTIDELEKKISDETIKNSFLMCHQTKDERNEQKKPDEFFNGTIKGDGFSCAVFSSPKTIELIGDIPPSKRKYFVDGTFKIVPIGPFSQLLIIHIGYLKSVR